jgi:hypothetical protein
VQTAVIGFGVGTTVGFGVGAVNGNYKAVKGKDGQETVRNGRSSWCWTGSEMRAAVGLGSDGEQQMT